MKPSSRDYYLSPTETTNLRAGIRAIDFGGVYGWYVDSSGTGLIADVFYANPAYGESAKAGMMLASQPLLIQIYSTTTA